MIRAARQGSVPGVVVVPRWWPVVVVVAAAGVFAGRISAAIRDFEPVGTWEFLLRPGLLIAVALVGFGLALVVARRQWATARAASVGSQVAMVVAVSLVLATPVGIAYDDGCNDHGTETALGLVPATLIFTPAGGAFAYEDLTTLRLCLDGDDHVPPIRPLGQR
jgi:hypothetical protein